MASYEFSVENQLNQLIWHDATAQRWLERKKDLDASSVAKNKREKLIKFLQINKGMEFPLRSFAFEIDNEQIEDDKSSVEILPGYYVIGEVINKHELVLHSPESLVSDKMQKISTIVGIGCIAVATDEEIEIIRQNHQLSAVQQTA